MALSCARCGKTLTGRQKKWCSVSCRNSGNKKVADPNIQKLIEVSVLSQKTNLVLTKSINELSGKVNSLVLMFQEAAKNVGEIRDVTKDEVDQIAKHLQEVVQQNKDLAEGLVALDNYTRHHKSKLPL
jgi:hypothetical protein